MNFEMQSEGERVLMSGYVWATGEDIGFRVGLKRFYFVLSDKLSYFETEESYRSGSKPINNIPLEEFSISKNVERGMFKLTIFA